MEFAEQYYDWTAVVEGVGDKYLNSFYLLDDGHKGFKKGVRIAILLVLNSV